MTINIAQSYSGGSMVGLAVIFLVIPTVFVGLRLWAKHLGAKGITWDDYLAFGSLVVHIACSICQLIAAVDGQLGQHQITDAKGMPILDDPRFLTYEKTKFAVNVLAIVSLGLIKASILIFYKNIFTLRPFRIAVYVMLGIVTSWTIAYFFANLFTCYPITPLVEPFYGKKCVNSIAMWQSAIVSDIILDFMILVMPAPMVLRLQLPLMQRLGVLGIFMLGTTVCCVSITRLLISLQIGAEFAQHFNDETYYTSPVFFWTNIETALAVVSACLPTLRPIYTHFRPSALPKSGYASGYMYKSSKGSRDVPASSSTGLVPSSVRKFRRVGSIDIDRDNIRLEDLGTHDNGRPTPGIRVQRDIDIETSERPDSM